MKNFIKGMISYVIPLRATSRKGEVNPYLEVRLERGKHVLNGAVMNHSFGKRKSIFKKVFSKYDFSERKIDKVLILGFGAGSVATILRKYWNLKCLITGVELDKAVIELQNEYFDPKRYEPLNLIHDDALKFVMNTKDQYDIIIMDVSIENNTPYKFMQKQFIGALSKILSPQGIIFYNKAIESSKHLNEAVKLHVLCNKILGETIVEKNWINGYENWIFIHQRLSHVNPLILKRHTEISSNIFDSHAKDNLSA